MISTENDHQKHVLPIMSQNFHAAGGLRPPPVINNLDDITKFDQNFYEH